VSLQGVRSSIKRQSKERKSAQKQDEPWGWKGKGLGGRPYYHRTLQKDPTGLKDRLESKEQTMQDAEDVIKIKNMFRKVRLGQTQ